MKIRQGFVSNSSSSSFIVSVFNVFSSGPDEEKKRLITLAQQEKLLDNGFKWTWSSSPMQVEYGGADETVEREKHPNLVISVTCNEDDEIGFLLDAKIPFCAVTHYGDYHVIFDGKHIVKILNQGMRYRADYLIENKKLDEAEIPDPWHESLTREEWLKCDNDFWKKTFEIEP